MCDYGCDARPPHSPGGLYGGARIEGGRISATGGKFWAKTRILWGIASGASGFRPKGTDFGSVQPFLELLVETFRSSRPGSSD